MRISCLALAMLLASPVLAREAEDRTAAVTRLFEEGNALAEAGKHAEALRKYEDALTLEPEARGPLFNGGLAAYLLKKYDVALDYWTRLKKLTPENLQVRAKLVQALEALGKREERDGEIAALRKLREETEDPELKETAFYCRDQFEAGGRKVMVFEHFEWVGDRAVRYRFEVLEAEGKPAYRISLGSYAYMQEFAESTGSVEKGQRYCHLDGYYPGGRHATFGFFAGEPPYDEIKEKVIAILKREAEPHTSSEPGRDR